MYRKQKFFEALKRMPNGKSPGNDGLIKAFFETFWSEVKTTFLTSSLHSLGAGELCISQRQAIKKSIEKKTQAKD